MSSTKALNKIRYIAEEYGWKFTEGYSGRGMYGRTCVGIVTESPNDCIAAVGIKGAQLDNMGMKYIVYWPNVKSEPEDE
jgi:hypothetical protein